MFQRHEKLFTQRGPQWQTYESGPGWKNGEDDFVVADFSNLTPNKTIKLENFPLKARKILIEGPSTRHYNIEILFLRLEA